MNLRNILMGNLCLLAALGSMQSQVEAAKKNQKNPKHSSCSSSSKSSKQNCCKEVLNDLDKIDKKFGCDKAHVISSVPAVIDKPGKWCVKKDLVYSGSGTAITIVANNVTLNFNNHSLTLENPSAIGVYANSVQELTVQNDIIKSTTISTNPISRAFYILNCEKVTLDNIFTANTFYGVDAVNSKDVFVTHSRFKDHIGGTDTASSGSIRVENCNAVVVEESTFSGAGKGIGQDNASRQIVFRGTSTACRISNCEFAGVEQAVGGFGIDGLIVENCVMQTALVKFPEDPSSPLTLFAALIQLGNGSGNEILASNVTVRNCVLNGNLVFTPDCLDPESSTCTVDAGYQRPIYIGQAHAILIDSCEIANFFVISDLNTFATSGLINILGFKDQIVRPTEITIRNCLAKGDGLFNFQHGIICQYADNVLVEGCTVTGTFFGINPNIGTRNMTIRDCTVQGTGHCSIIFGTSDGEIDGVTIANNHLMNPGFNSIQITKNGSSEGLIKNVIVEGNTINNGNASGIYFSQTENCVARNNIIDTVRQVGIPVVNSVNTTIQDNTVLNTAEGIQVVGDEFETSNTVVKGNTVSSSGFNGIIVQDATNTTVENNSCDYNGLTDLAAGIVVVSSTKTSLIDNSCIGNSGGGIEIVAGSTDTYVQNNTTTQNGIVGLNDDDNTGQVTAFFNKSCDNGVDNCINIPFAVAPGDPVYMGANLCCDNPDDLVGAKKVKASATGYPNPIGSLPEAEEAPDLSLLPQF